MPSKKEPEVNKYNPELNAQFLTLIPHARTLGIELVELSDNKVICKIPYKEDLIGNPQTRVIHGGVITSLVDSVCGIVVFRAMTEPSSLATLDLRIDYMKPATPGQDLYAVGHCYKMTQHIAFARATAYQDNIDDPVAVCVATFMRTALTKGGIA